MEKLHANYKQNTCIAEQISQALQLPLVILISSFFYVVATDMPFVLYRKFCGQLMILDKYCEIKFCR